MVQKGYCQVITSITAASINHSEIISASSNQDRQGRLNTFFPQHINVGTVPDSKVSLSLTVDNPQILYNDSHSVWENFVLAHDGM